MTKRDGLLGRNYLAHTLVDSGDVQPFEFTLGPTSRHGTLPSSIPSRIPEPIRRTRTRGLVSSHTIVNVGYRSTNYWVVSAGTARLLVDIGWPGTMGAMKASLKRMGVPLAQIRYALATHYHIDHAGLAEEFKREGVPLLVLEEQAAAIPTMKAFAKPWDLYLEITMDGNVVISCQESRQLLYEIGLCGEILHTPGHSDDSVSLLLDDGSAFTGDLPPEGYAWDNPVALVSWRMLRERGARRVYPAHGPIRAIDPGPLS